MATILVTGATGFIGTRLVEALRHRQDRVIALGRTNPRVTGVEFLPCDFSDAARSIAQHTVLLRQVEAVAHLGGFVLHSSQTAADDWAVAQRLNLEATVQLAHALPSTLRAFCYTSTLDVYGPPVALPVTEDHPTRPVSYYGVSKLAAESWLRVHCERTGVPVTILRLSQVFGPGDTSAKAIPNFIRATLRGEPLPVRGDGQDVRDYVYVDDVTAAIVTALDRRLTATCNIACGEGRSIREVVAAIGGRAPQWETTTRPPSRIVLDISRARQLLNYRPQFSLEEGLCRMMAWFRDEHRP